MEWYWNQPGVPHVAEFVREATKKRTGRVPSARTWFGYVSVWTCALAAAKANSLKAIDMAKALQDYRLPARNRAWGRARPSSRWPRSAPRLVVRRRSAGKRIEADDLFKVASRIVNGADAAGPLEESGCKMTWPA